MSYAMLLLFISAQRYIIASFLSLYTRIMFSAMKTSWNMYNNILTCNIIYNSFMKNKNYI